MMKLGSTFFLFALVSNLAYIEYRWCQIWSAYMQYLRCYDHSNKCLFLVIQQAEVLLNFIWWVYVGFTRLNGNEKYIFFIISADPCIFAWIGKYIRRISNIPNLYITFRAKNILSHLRMDNWGAA